MVFGLRIIPGLRRFLEAMQPKRIAVLGLCAVLAAFATESFASSAERGRVFGYLSWDKEYFYFAAKVDDENVVGTNDRPLSEPWQDDSVELCFDIAGTGGDAPNPACARLAMSAAGGFTALVGTADGTWKSDPAWTLGLRFDVAVQGTLNKGRDKDAGYVLEVAVPWRFLGGTPEPGSEIGFNVVCHLRGEQEGFASWSPTASVPSDLDRPSTWGRLVFESYGRPAVAEGAVVRCPRLPRGPKIDAALSPDEWMGASVLRFDLPAAPPAVQASGTARSTQVMALYFYPTAVPVLSLAQPREGLGPWWTGESVEWHKRQVKDVRLAGIDTLAVACGASDRKPEARRSLACLVQALKDLKADRRTYPLLAPYLEAEAFGAGRPNSDLYSVIREFFSTVPAEFRAQTEAAGQRSHIVVLGPPKSGALQQGLIQECSTRFKQDFPGRSLLWLGEEGWKEKGIKFEGYWSQAPGVAYQPSGRVKVGTISPGTGGAQSEAYYSGWVRLINLGPDFVLINSWNNFADGTQICASRQHGVALADMTRRYAAQLAARSDAQVSLRRDTVPDVMAPGQEYQIELLLDNSGFSDISPRENITFEYDLQSVQEPTVKVTRDAARMLRIPAGATVPVVAYVSTFGKREALPQGNYLLKLKVNRSKVPIFTSPLWQQSLGEFVFPVQVGRVPPLKATLVSSNLPAHMQAGATYAAAVRLRNDGASAWKRGQVRVFCRWLWTDGEASSGASPWQPASAGDLPADVTPGQMITIPVTIGVAGQPDGEAGAGEDWRFLEWGLAQGGRDPAPVAHEMVQIVKWDSGLRLIRSEAPRQMEAGKQDEALLTIGNIGPSTWKANETEVMYGWYYLDGVPVPGTQATAPLPVDTPPGKLAVVRVSIQAPPSGGTYLLDFRAAPPGRGSAPQNDGGGRSFFDPVAIAVKGGPFEPVDLAQHFNAAATSTAARRSAGDFDGAGRSLPAEQIPPDLSLAEGGWYPCGYYSGELKAPRQVPFMFPKLERGLGLCAACAGQRVQLPAGPIIRVHLIAAATQPGVTASFALSDESGKSKSVSLPIGYWLQAPDSADERGFQTPYLRAATSDEPTPAYLRHYSLEAVGAVAVELPKDPRVKVLALTVERGQPGP